jgi:hypothetical protein
MIYRKQGAVARWENGTLVRVTESGMAIEEGETFTCKPEGQTSLTVDSTRVIDTARAVQDITKRIERLIVTEGIAEHEWDDRTWRDHTERIHLSLVRGETRALVDIGSFDLEDVRVIADAMERMIAEREAPPRLRLARNVTAAVLPSLIGIEPPNVELTYTLDWFRPSYRVRPVKVPMNVALRCDVTEIDRTRPIAVAILEPVRDLTLKVLVDDGEAAWPATVRLVRIDAVARDLVWYPYGGGSFGAEMML